MVLSAEQFICALARTSSTIRLLSADRQKIRDLNHEQAITCFATGHYQAVGRASRVRYLQALSKDVLLPASVREYPADASFWHDRHLWTWTAADFGRSHPMALDGAPA